ncbi:hypothetical protein M0657_011151 [Pyricularia oryzae]|nr:hypothetical protein M0657_011151 [Pyricularia oryzae]
MPSSRASKDQNCWVKLPKTTLVALASVKFGLSSHFYSAILLTENMGQKHSVLEPPPPVNTFDKFIDKFRCHVKTITSRDKKWLDAIFTEFGCTESATSAAVWDESSLSRFLHTVVPEPLWPDIEDAVPLLHRCLVRLGAYPYHNVPPYGPLTADVALVAMGIIHNHEHRGRWSPISWDCDPGDLDQEWAAWACRVLFQCMSIAAAGAAEEPAARTDADDRDLLGAHETVERWNYTRDWERAPKRISRGEPIVQVRDLPSSRSQSTRGMIPQAEFRSLVKLLLCYQLCEAGYEPGLILDQVDRDLSTATDCVLAAFSTSDSEQRPGIGWDAFQAGTITIGPNLFQSPCFACLPYSPSSSLDDERGSMPSSPLSTKDMITWTKGAFLPPTSSNKGLPERPILNNVATLSQLLTVFPTRFERPLETAVYRIPGADCDLGALYRHLTFWDDPTVLLISAASLPERTAAQKPGPSPGSSLCLGAVYPTQEWDRDYCTGTMFQVAPSPTSILGRKDAQICLQEGGRVGSCVLRESTLEFSIETVKVFWP